MEIKVALVTYSDDQYVGLMRGDMYIENKIQTQKAEHIQIIQGLQQDLILMKS